MIDYSSLDQPYTLRYIFYPRRDLTSCPDSAFDHSVDVGDGVSISTRFYMGHQEWPWILFFHGNGEVVSDYDQVSTFYHKKMLNLVVADYRGYGGSSGTPTLAHLVDDSHILLREVRQELSRRNLRRDPWVMGRSLGSTPALELACEHQDLVNGLIIESGFPSVMRLITHLGIPVNDVDPEKFDQECLERIKKISLPSLIIHGQQDTLVPVRNAEDLYENLGTHDKELLVIPSATHNDIMIRGFQQYFVALQRFVERTDKKNRLNEKT